MRVIEVVDSRTCKHPPARYYCWLGFNCVTKQQDWLVVCCSDCGLCLKGSYEEYETYLRAHLPAQERAV